MINAIIFSTQGNMIKSLQAQGTTLPTVKNSFISGICFVVVVVARPRNSRKYCIFLRNRLFIYLFKLIE